MQNITAKNPKSSKPLIRPATALIAAAVLGIGGITVYGLRQFSSSQPETPTEATAPKITTVTALGRIEPNGEIVEISAPSSSQGSRVAQLLVQEGDTVAAEQTIAILDSRDRLQAALNQAEERVRVAQANLARVKAGAKTGEIEAQRATIARIQAERDNDIAAQAATVARLTAELNNAQVEYQRYQQLYTNGAISASERDSKALTLETAQRRLEEAQANLTRIRAAQQQQLNEARATLERIAEVRPVDVEVAAAEVREAQAAVATAQAELALATIKTPQSGQIIKILTRPGEDVSSEGIATIGQTSQMYAIAEVYESDISKVQVGQPATITSSAISGELHGTVERIGLEIQRQEVVNTDPTANIDAKVVEVKVRLNEESSQRVAGLTNLQVTVAISLPNNQS
ncbi:MAG: ABC exporter membrane fusion protein [Cyanophyceae cyanobacterium]